MILTERISQHVEGIFFGGNWTSVNYSGQLEDITVEEALEQVGPLNTVAVLTFHVAYFVRELVKMIKGGPLEAKDKLSFEIPPIYTQQDWDKVRDGLFTDAHELIAAIKEMPADRLSQFLGDEKYGDFYYNIHGIIEHAHYHLGQIAIIRKIIRKETATTEHE